MQQTGPSAGPRLTGARDRTASTDSAGRWEARPHVARSLGAAAFLVPIVAAVAGTLLMNDLLPAPHGLLGHAGWWLALLAAAIVPMQLAVVGVRRWLSLSMLLRLALVFPDEAPSRFEVAKRAHRTRDLQREVWRLRGSVSDTRIHAASSVLALVSAVGDHDRATRGHSERVRIFTDLLADEMGLTVDEKEKLRWASLLHDVGKLAVPTDVLNKPGRPDDEEWEIIRRHPSFGVRIMTPLKSWLGPWFGAVEQHHEKYDGTGYPQRLSGDHISLGGRIVAVADSFEVMTAARAYKRPMPVGKAREELVACAGSHFDPTVVRAFLRISTNRMRWLIGLGALLAQLPVIGYLSYRGIPQRLGRQAASIMTAASLVAAGAASGALDLKALGDRAPARARRIATAPREEPATRALEPHVDGTHARHEDEVSSGTGSESADDVVAVIPIAPEPAGPGDDEPPDPAPRRPEPAPPEEREPFVAVGRTELPGLLGARDNVTASEFRARCSPPASQGLDAWVFSLPRPATGRLVDLAALDGVGAASLQAIAYSAECTELGSYSGAGFDGIAVPEATDYFLLSTPTAAHVTLRLTVTWTAA